MRIDLRLMLWVMLGGAVGSALRFAIGVLMQQRSATAFPSATLLINVSGSFLLGLIIEFSLSTTTLGPGMRLLLTAGFCGGFTTFSTFSFESVALIQNGHSARAALYVGASVVLSFLATAGGISLAQRITAAARGG